MTIPLPGDPTLFEMGRYLEQKNARMRKSVLDAHNPHEMSEMLADYLVQRFGRNVAELTLMAAQNKVNCR